MLYLQSFLRKGVSLGHVGRNKNLKDLKAGFEECTALARRKSRDPWEEARHLCTVTRCLSKGCWILEILYCNPKGHRALLRVPSKEGRGVRLCWALSKPEGPQGLKVEQSERGGGGRDMIFLFMSEEPLVPRS